MTREIPDASSPAPEPYPPLSRFEPEPYEPQSTPSGPPTGGFVPPELLGRRRAAAPPSTPYQPIAWSNTSAFAAPASAAAPADEATQVGAPPTGSVPVSAPPPPPPTAPHAHQHLLEAPPHRGRMLFGLIAAVLVMGLVVGGILSTRDGDKEDTQAPTPAPTATAAPVALKPQVASWTTSGEGFSARGQTWKTNTYNSVEFGNLKPGVGLVLDVGEANSLASVGLDAGGGPLDLELRSADQVPAQSTSGLSDWKKVGGSSTSGAGAVTLDAAKGGRHRYWMIWVTKLGSSRQAVLSDLKVTAAS